VGLIGVQAGAARTALDRSPETTEQRLLAIEQSSRSAVYEMGRLLGVLRSDGGGGELCPQPGLAALGSLVESFSGAGLQVAVTVDEPLGPLSPVVDLCAYRMVEEALTNVARHSSAAHVCVALARRHGVVHITVHDDGPARHVRTATPTTGRGLVGMRERAALCNGEVHAGPDAAGGFTVEAVLREPRAG
jgi:signal transduction histidine kinase